MPLVCVFAQVEEAIERELIFRQNTKISQPRLIKITDIAELRGFNAVELQTISNFPLNIKFENNVAVVENSVLSRKIRGLVSQLGPDVQVRIPSQLKIEIVGKSINADWVRKILSVAIIENCPHCEYQIQRVKFQKPKNAQIKKYELQIPQFRGGSFSWPLILETDNGREVISVSGFLKLYLMGPVAQRILSTGDRIQAEDFQIERVDVTHRLRPLARSEQLMDSKLRKSVMPGKPIYQSDIAREKLVETGETVSVVLRRGSLKVRASGQSLSSGDIGDSIRVKTNKHKRILTAIVKQKGVVEVR